MEVAYLFDEDSVCLRHVIYALAVQRLRCEADEIDRVPEPESIADRAHRLEAADTWSLARARVDDDHRPLALVDLDAGRGKDTDQRVVDRSWQRVSTQHELEIIDQDRIDGAHPHLLILIAATP